MLLYTFPENLTIRIRFAAQETHSFKFSSFFCPASSRSSIALETDVAWSSIAQVTGVGMGKIFFLPRHCKNYNVKWYFI